MKRYINFVVGLVSIYYACTISISPKSAQGEIGDKLDFKITVKHIHLPCLLAINATEFKYDKVSLLKESAWDSINPITFEKTITVRLDRDGKGEIDVSRTCPIRTSEAKVEIEIKGKDLTAVLAETKKWLEAASNGDTISLNRLKSLQEWFSGNYEMYLPKKNTDQWRKNFLQFLNKLKKLVVLVDSLKVVASEVSKSEILK